MPVADVFFLPRNGTEPDMFQAKIRWDEVADPIPGRWEATSPADGEPVLLTLLGGHHEEPGVVLIAATGEGIAEIAVAWGLAAP